MLVDLNINRPKSNLLKWAGSKASIVGSIEPYLDFSLKYCELFCGSASIFFKFGLSSAVLNDTNGELISFYQQLVKNPKGLWTKYFSLDVSESNYYEIRKKFNLEKCKKIKAAYFLYLNHYGFNGIYRTNMKGELNTPFGAKIKAKRKLDLDEILYFSSRLQGVEFSNLDFETYVKKHYPENMCIYLDPPYFTKDSRVFGEYGKTTFKSHDLERLYQTCLLLSENNRVVLSYKSCTEFNALFREYITGEIMVGRNVGGFAGRRKQDKELIAVLDNR